MAARPCDKACNLSLGYYEGHQRAAGLVLEPYENYLAAPPVQRMG